MFTAKQYRAKAAESAESGKQSNDPGEIRKYQRLEKSFTELAKNEDWLANNFDKIIHSNDILIRVTTAERVPMSPRARSVFFAALAPPSSCIGARFQRRSSGSSSIPQGQWETC